MPLNFFPPPLSALYRWSCPSLTAVDVRPAAEIAAYRAFSTTICAEIEQMNPGAPPCAPGVTPSTTPYDVESTSPGKFATGERPSKGLDGGRGLTTDPSTDNVEILGSRTAPNPRTLPERGRSTTIADGQTTQHSPGVAERDGYVHGGGDSGDASTGSTFLTDGRRADSSVAREGDAYKCQQKAHVSGKGSKSASGYAVPDDCFAGVAVESSIAAPSTDRGVVEDRHGDHDDTNGGDRSTFSDSVGQRERQATSDTNSAAADAIAGKSAMEGGGVVGIEVGGEARRGLGRLWDRGLSPPDSFDKQRVAPTSAR